MQFGIVAVSSSAMPVAAIALSGICVSFRHETRNKWGIEEEEVRSVAVDKIGTKYN